MNSAVNYVKKLALNGLRLSTFGCRVRASSVLVRSFAGSTFGMSEEGLKNKDSAARS